MKKAGIFAATFLITLISIAAIWAFRLSIANSESEIGNEHRRMIRVHNFGNAETLIDYQILLNITYDSDMQHDFDDLRFTWHDEASNQEVNLDYWLDKYIDSKYALVWVEVPSIRGLGQEVLYMYYGDPDAVSESNGEETFVFFDGFSADTTANYQLWSPTNGTGNQNEFSWDPNGWLFVNASIRERAGRNSNVHVYHKTAVMDPSADQYWLETRCKAFGEGWLDYLGVCNLFKQDSMPQDVYFRTAKVEQGIRDVYPMNKSSISGGWGDWEFYNSSDLPTSVIEQWFRIGLGTDHDGMVVGSFRDDSYSELCTLVGQTIHQDTKWWVDLIISRTLTDDWATMHAYFDYVRVRKFTDPEPSYSIGSEEPLSATVDVDPDTLNLKSNGQWITAYVTLPTGYIVEDIVLETVYLDGIPAAWSEIQNGVYMAKFERAAVQDHLTNEPDYDSAPKFYDITLTVAGELVDGTAFEGSDTIRVLEK